MKNFIEDDHLPGLHWYHPHKHGSTSSQAFTSNGLILVDDDDAWLPDDGGCAPFKKILNSSPDYILHIELLTFGPPVASNISDANYQELSEEGNSTLCCGGSPLNDLDGLGADEDIAFINGGYQPMIPATSGKWQRWKVAHTGYKRFMVLQIIDPVTNAPTKACEIHLIAKDGVYLLEIPRRTDYIFLSAGNRAEVLVRCFGPPGKEYILSSGQLPLPIGGGSDFQAATMSHQQPIMATIRMSENTSGSNDTDLVNKGCTPLRPSYASNLLNAPADKIFYDANATFGFTPSGCLIGGKAFEYPEPYPLQMPLGKVVEWSIADLTFHPWHAHVSPFQIKTLSIEGLFPNMTYTNWFEDGDFHDTLQLPMHEDAGCMRVMRFSCVDGDVQPFDCSPYFTYPVIGTWKAGPTPPTPLPSPSPPTPKPCSYAQGTYQLIPQGRSKCAPKSEYLVYSGGNSTSCKSNSVKLQQGGIFDSKRSKWAIEATQSVKSTPMLTVGRGCSSGKENGLAGSSKSSNTTVFLAGTGHRWTINPISSGDCSTVKIIDSSRYNDGSPAYLTVSLKCGEKSVTLAKLKAVGDTQAWKIKKV